jgi:hypothetical protein
VNIARITEPRITTMRFQFSRPSFNPPIMSHAC